VAVTRRPPYRQKKKAAPKKARPAPRVHLNRAMSKLGILTRSQATEAIMAGRVRVNGRVVVDPAEQINPSVARIEVDEQPAIVSEWRTILFHKPRGVVTTRTDPAGRTTVYDVLKDDGQGLIPIGRLDQASTGLLLLTTDTGLAAWITDPANAVVRLYVVSVRGKVTPEEAAQMEAGITIHGDQPIELRADVVTIRKASNRESHLTVQLREGKNRQVRRLCEALGHEVLRLKRVQIAGIELDALEPGEWRDLTHEEVERAFPHFVSGRNQASRDAGIRPPTVKPPRRTSRG
jgi:23S rRNA pseudouridine2605 synthase